MVVLAVVMHDLFPTPIPSVRKTRKTRGHIDFVVGAFLANGGALTGSHPLAGRSAPDGDFDILRSHDRAVGLVC